jgi:hypothetical protein
MPGVILLVVTFTLKKFDMSGSGKQQMHTQNFLLGGWGGADPESI